MTRVNRCEKAKANAEHVIASHIVPVGRYGTIKTKQGDSDPPVLLSKTCCLIEGMVTSLIDTSKTSITRSDTLAVIHGSVVYL